MTHRWNRLEEVYNSVIEYFCPDALDRASAARMCILTSKISHTLESTPPRPSMHLSEQHPAAESIVYLHLGASIGLWSSMKPLATLCGGRANLQCQDQDLSFDTLKHLIKVIKNMKSNRFERELNECASLVEHVALYNTSEPMRDLLTYFLVIIDKLAGGDGCYNKLLDGTSSIYDEGHLIINRHPSWVTIVRSKGYEYLALGHYMSSDGTRMKLWVPLHHMICYLRWGGAGLQGTHVVCHDFACPHRHCLSPGCLRWGDPCDNAQDRVARRAYLSTVHARGGREAARTSEASPPMRCS